MGVDLSSLLPNLSQSLDGTGFIFGAGASFEAGYPLMTGLTRDVISALTPDERDLTAEALKNAGLVYDPVSAVPNIEQIADHIIAHLTNTSDVRYLALEERIRTLILDCILSVSSPKLEHHCRFIESLKRRAFGIACTVWIFTTNYDLLFEQAAAENGVAVENGFSGATHRFFNPQQFRHHYGEVRGHQFSACPSLTIRLIKLHGSVSWFKNSASFCEQHPAALGATQRAMILPRRRKVMDTLVPPFDSLFTVASRVLGNECKYIVSCGFGYGDEHINANLLLPPMQGKRCRLYALSQEEPEGVGVFNNMPNYQAAFETHLHKDGKKIPGGTDAWKFSAFVKLFD